MTTKSESSYLKNSFAPISNSETKILILGTLPGDKSLELGEYYGHARNRFWRIIATITNNEIPQDYDAKKLLLLKSKIGVWDIAHKAHRKGSLDSAIVNEVPNDITSFINQHKNLKVIGFNGLKSEALYNRYFQRQAGINYFLLPSSSPANAKIDFERICAIWREMLVI